MKITYIITAYNAPKALERLIDRLTDDEVSFIVHIDAKGKEMFDIEKLKKHNNAKIFSFNNVDWGGIQWSTWN